MGFWNECEEGKGRGDLDNLILADAPGPKGQRYKPLRLKEILEKKQSREETIPEVKSKNLWEVDETDRERGNGGAGRPVACLMDNWKSMPQAENRRNGLPTVRLARGSVHRRQHFEGRRERCHGRGESQEFLASKSAHRARLQGGSDCLRGIIKMARKPKKGMGDDGLDTSRQNQGKNR